MAASTRHRRGTKRHQLQRRSVPASPKVVFAVERFFDVIADVKPLLSEQWNELGRDKARVRLDPDWSAFAELDTRGVLKIVTARADGVLVGYVATMLSFHLHYKSTRHATVNSYWLAPRFRRGWTGVELLRKNENVLRDLGVVRIFADDSAAFKNARGRKTRALFKRMGYTPTGIVYRKML